MKQKTAALYMRVSTEEQARHGDSIEAQRQALREYAVAHDLAIVGEYADEGISGQKPVRKRPALSEMLAEVEAGKIDLILFTKLDRWFRSVKLYYQAQEVLDRRKKFDIRMERHKRHAFQGCKILHFYPEYR